ncbi:MAG: hypothetical protein FWE38_01805 [Firmicutes bacterium]|nr:hypothetical protein [Bacillota bacterium]
MQSYLDKLYTVNSSLALHRPDIDRNVLLRDPSIRRILDLGEFHRGVEAEHLGRDARMVYDQGCCGKFAERAAADRCVQRMYSFRQDHIYVKAREAQLNSALLLDSTGVIIPAKYPDTKDLSPEMFEYGHINYTANTYMARNITLTNEEQDFVSEYEMEVQNFIDDLVIDYFPEWQAMLHETKGEKRNIVLPEKFHTPKRDIHEMRTQLPPYTYGQRQKAPEPA